MGGIEAELPTAPTMNNWKTKIEIALSPGRVAAMLYELCLKYGYCLPPEANQRLENDPPRTIDGFLDEVARVEGIDPRTLGHRDQLRAIVERYFVAEAEAARSRST